MQWPGKYGALAEYKSVCFAVKEIDSRKVRRQKVYGELDALEIKIERLRQRLGGFRLAGAGDIFEENMSAYKEGYEQEFYLLILSDYDFVDISDKLL